MTLIQPGAAPRQVLRYHLTKGSKVTSQLECDADVKSPELASAMPTQVIQLETAVDDILADGAARLRITILDATVRERAAPPTSAPAAGGAPNLTEPATASPSTASPSTASPSTASPSTAPPSTAPPSTAPPPTAPQPTGQPQAAQPSTAQPATAPPPTGPPPNGQAPIQQAPTPRAPARAPTGQASIAEASIGDASGGDPSNSAGANSAASAAAAHSGAAISGAASSGAGGNHAVRSGAVSSGALSGAAAGGKPTSSAAASPPSPPGEVSIDAMRAQAAAMRGVVITETLAPDGTVSDAHIAGGTSTDKIRGELDGLLHSLEHVATRLPAEPVGLGAIWRERRTLPEGGVRAVSEITYTLASITGSTFGFTTTGTSTGDAQTVEQEGTKLEVTDTHGRSTASGSVDLARYAVDVVATSTFATTMKVLAPAAGSGDGKSTIEIAMAIRLASALAAITAAAPSAPAAPADTAPTAAAPTTAAPTAAAPAAAAPTAAAPAAAAPTAAAPSAAGGGPAADRGTH